MARTPTGSWTFHHPLGRLPGMPSKPHAMLPDPIPFVDELVFGLGTLLLANWKRRKDPPGKDPPALPDNSPR